MGNTLPLWAETVAVFDTETTGVDVSHSRVVSSTVALLGPAGEVLERYDWLIDPGVDIPTAAAQVHGITTEVARASGVRAEIGLAQLITQLQSMLERGFPLVVYNAPYDFTLLRAEAARHDLPWIEPLEPVIDPLVIDRHCDRYRKGKRTLEVVADYYGISLGQAHDAGEDAIAAGRIAQALALRYAHVLPGDALALHHEQREWAASQAANFQEYMRRVKNPAFVANGSWPIYE